MTSASLLFDLHGNVAATEQTTNTKIANAIRYDGYGHTLRTPYIATGSITLDTKYHGRLDVSPSSGFAVYDLRARLHAPTLGSTTTGNFGLRAT